MNSIFPKSIGNDGAALLNIEPPFNPFTLDEIQAITGISPTILDKWMRRMVLQRGCGEVGLNNMQTFAIFVGKRYLDEGAPTGRAEMLVDYVALMTLEFLNQEFAQGRTFPVPAQIADTHFAQSGYGCLVPAPRTKLGRTLNLRILLEEFDHNIRRVFPKG